MTDFERVIVNGLNEYFESDEHPYKSGFAKRDQQDQYHQQVTDVLVWKPELFIECKALKTKSTGGVGFREHFSTETEDEDHQIQRQTDLLNRTGCKGVLALELRNGPGTPKECYLIDWSLVFQRWDDPEKPNSIRFHELDDLCEAEDDGSAEYEPPKAVKVPREGGEYQFNQSIFEWFFQIHG